MANWQHTGDEDGSADLPEFSVNRKDSFTGTTYRGRSTQTHGHSL